MIAAVEGRRQITGRGKGCFFGFHNLGPPYALVPYTFRFIGTQLILSLKRVFFAEKGTCVIDILQLRKELRFRMHKSTRLFPTTNQKIRKYTSTFGSCTFSLAFFTFCKDDSTNCVIKWLHLPIVPGAFPTKKAG